MYTYIPILSKHIWTKELGICWKGINKGGRSKWQGMAKDTNEKYNKDLAEYENMVCKEIEAKSKCKGSATAAEEPM